MNRLVMEKRWAPLFGRRGRESVAFVASVEASISCENLKGEKGKSRSLHAERPESLETEKGKWFA